MVNAELPRRTLRQQMIDAALASPSAASSNDIAALVAGIWQRVSEQFGPLIGTRSVHLIFARSVELHRNVFPWLTIDAAPHRAQPRFVQHCADLLGQAPAEALGASGALLVTFAELLEALIGANMTDLFLRIALTPGVSGAVTKERQS